MDLNRKEALRTGAKHYVPAKPCKRGHRERSTRTMDCIQCGFDKQRDPKNRAYRLWASAKDRAKAGLPFNVTREYIESIWPKDNCCPILLVELKGPVGDQRGVQPTSPTLDRIVPQLGYVTGNVAVISQRANAMKQDCYKSEVFRRLADYLDQRIVNMGWMTPGAARHYRMQADKTPYDDSAFIGIVNDKLTRIPKDYFGPRLAAMGRNR